MTINGPDFLAPDLAAALEVAAAAAATGPVTSTRAAVRARRRVFPGDPAQVAHARRFVQRTLAPHGPAADAALLTSELATNAIRHSASGRGGTFEVIIWQARPPSASPSTDAGSPSIPVPVPPGLLTSSGRGLALVDALACRWGQHTRPARQNGVVRVACLMSTRWTTVLDGTRLRELRRTPAACRGPHWPGRRASAQPRWPGSNASPAPVPRPDHSPGSPPRSAWNGRLTPGRTAAPRLVSLLSLTVSPAAAWVVSVSPGLEEGCATG